MGLNWSEFFSRAGSGLSDYAAYAYRQSEDKREREREDRKDARQVERDKVEDERNRRSDIRDDRKALQGPAEDEAADLRKAGIHVPSFVQDSMQSRLPNADQAIPDAGGMAVNALRGAGQAGVDRAYSKGSEALGRAFSGTGLSEPIEGGGVATIAPSVRATLRSAESSAATHAADRQSREQIARERIAASKAKGTSDPMADDRMKFITGRAEELQKPQLDARGFRVIGPGKSQAEAFNQAKQEWEEAKGGIQTEEPTPVELPSSTGGSAALAEPGLGSFGGGSPLSAMDPEAVEAVRKEALTGDDEQDRADLEAAGYSDEEIDILMGQ